MKKDKPLDRVLFNVEDLRIKERWNIFPEEMAEYIPDFPARLGLFLWVDNFDVWPLSAITTIYPAFAFYETDRNMNGLPSDPLDGEDLGWTVGDLNFDAREPEKFDYIQWLRACLLCSDRRVRELANYQHSVAAGCLKSEVEYNLFLTYFDNWKKSWIRRGMPIYLGNGTTNLICGKAQEYRMDYPLDPDLSAH